MPHCSRSNHSKAGKLTQRRLEALGQRIQDLERHQIYLLDTFRLDHRFALHLRSPARCSYRAYCSQLKLQLCIQLFELQRTVQENPAEKLSTAINNESR